MSENAGKTVAEILRGKRALILKSRLDAGSPSWRDIMHLSWEEVVSNARRRKTGFRTFRKLLTCGRFNKP